MNDKTKQMLADLETATMEAIWIPNDLLPERYNDDREGGRTLARLQEQLEEPKEIDPRQETVVVSHGEIISGNQERIDILNKYQANVQAGEEIEYDVNDYKLHRNMMAFCSAMNIDLS